MISLFLGLTIANVIAMLTTIGLGYAAVGQPAWRPWHVLSGALTALLCVAVHCVVFTYFVATAKWVRHAVAVKGLDAGFVTPTRSFKAAAFPAALAGMTAIFTTAILGAAVDTRALTTVWHHAAALTAVAVNLGAAAVEYGAIARNGRLIQNVLAEAGKAGAE